MQAMHLVFQWLEYGTDSGETSSRLVDETIGAVTGDAASCRSCVCVCVCDKAGGEHFACNKLEF